jgi:hypothetical protein
MATRSGRRGAITAITARTLTGPKIKADAATLVISADKEGKLRVLCSSREEPIVVLKGRELVIRNIGGQVHVYDVEVA